MSVRDGVGEMVVVASGGERERERVIITKSDGFVQLLKSRK